MRRRKFKLLGFTLVELLAVLVILGITLAITVPLILGIIDKARMGAMESDAKLIIDAIDYKKLEDTGLISSSINAENVKSVLGISDDNYKKISITEKNGKDFIVVIGQNKWDNLVAYGPKDSITVVKYEDFIKLFPIITLLGNNPTDIVVNGIYTEAGATASDSVDGNITSSISATGAVDTNTIGAYSIIYSVTNSLGNTMTETRTINVVENNPPVVTFGTNGNSTYAKSRSTTVTITDDVGVDASSLKYQWNTSTTTPTEVSFSSTFTNGGTISSPAGVTGGYYLWILVKDTRGVMTIRKSNVFNLDNTIPVITILGNNPAYVDQNSTYTDAGATATDNIDGNITADISVVNTVNTSITGTYTVTYNVTDATGNVATQAVRTVHVVTPVNAPVLAGGMVPIKWNGTTWIDTVSTDGSWYDYSSGSKQWANARTQDGSMWVWIPRYAYQISSGYHTSTVGTINIKFLRNSTNTAYDSSTVVTVPTYSGSSQTNYIEHPAFKFGTTELSGIWVAKFEMSGTTASLDSKPGIASLRSTTLGNMFTASRNMETNSKYGWGLASGLNTDGTFTTDSNGVDTHMMKSIEWGVVAYLTQSIYGKNSELYINNSSTYTTGCSGGSASAASYSGCQYTYDTSDSGTGASTTGTIYGIYDISGGANEYVMGNFNDQAGSSGLTPGSINNKYIDRYINAYDNTKYGDAVYETSSSSTGSTSWYGDYSEFIGLTSQWMTHGAHANGGTIAGAFYFGNSVGSSLSLYSWRSVILVSTGL